MSKKPNPNAAFSQTLTPVQKAFYSNCVVRNQEDMFFLFTDASKSIAIIKPKEVYGNFDDFSKRVTEADLLSLHKMCFEKEPTDKELKDPVELKVKVWIRLCETSTNRLDAASVGVRATSEKLKNRKYEVVSLERKPEVKMPPQMITCLTFFAELMAADAAYQAIDAAERGIFEVTEEKFKTYVVEQSARLHTRQDPWRIFQYYRPELIKAGHIRLV